MTSPTKPNPGTRVLLGVLAFCSLVALTVGPLLVVRYREASRVLSDYSRSLVHGDFRAAYAQLSPQAQATLPFDGFVSQQKTLRQRIGPLREVKRAGFGVYGDGWPLTWRANFEVDQVYRDDILRFTYDLRMKQGRWAIWSYQTNN